MGRTYKKRVGAPVRRNYRPDNVNKAVQEVKAGILSYRRAAEKYGVPRSTIVDKVNKTHPKVLGGQPVLNMKDENILIEGILRAAHWGFPLSSTDVRYIVKGFLDRSGRREVRFKNNLPGVEWATSFLNRHSRVLSVRLCENIKRSRAEVTKRTVEEFFQNIQGSLDGVSPSNIINYDETNFSDDPGRKKVIVKRGAKHAERILDSTKTSISVMMAGTGDGVFLPPYILYKAEHMWSTWQEGGPPGANYNRNKSGWFDLPTFEDWFLTVALPYLRKLSGRKVMIGDNLSSHISLQVIKLCKEHNISFVLLPPNSTHLLQPLDVSFFKPLKDAWHTVLSDWKKFTKGPISKDAFPFLLNETLKEIEASKSINIIISGFRGTGLIPFNPNHVISKLPDSEESPVSNEMHWSESFEKILKDCRYRKAEPAKRRKKLDIPAGTSVLAHHLSQEEDEASLLDSSSSNTSIATEVSAKATGTQEDETIMLKEETFLVANYEYKKGNNTCIRQFVGMATKVGAKDVDVMFLRQYNNSKHIFVFPPVADEDTITKDKIAELLLPPKEVKGKFIFDKEVL